MAAFESGLDEGQIDAYLGLLGFANRPKPDRETLDASVFSHQCKVPFSSLDIYRTKIPPDLSIQTVYDKVVIRRRGGYCFELNRLFERLLAALGFRVRPVIGRAVLGRKVQIPINHRGILVALGGEEYFVDVGFGGPTAAGAVMLDEGCEQTFKGETFCMRKVDDAWWALERVIGTIEEGRGLRTETEFCTAAVKDCDFESLNLWRSSPGSPFYDGIVMNRRTEEGSISLANKVLTVMAKGDAAQKEVSEEAFDEVLESYFGLHP